MAAADKRSAVRNRSAILLGPQGSGKSLVAPLLAAALGLPIIVEDWGGGEDIEPRFRLYVTNNAAVAYRDEVITVEQALALLRGTLSEVEGRGTHGRAR